MPDEVRGVRVDDPGAAWEPLSLTDSEPAVHRVVLRAEGRGGASVQAVRFPPGWRRPTAGHFLVTEEFVVLRGQIELSGVVVRAGEWAVVPPGALRVDSAVGGEGCLAVAWFDAAPRWERGPAAAPEGPITTRTLDGVLLREGDGLHATADTAEVFGPADVICTDGRWSWVPEGVTMALPSGPALVRPWPRAGPAPGR